MSCVLEHVISINNLEEEIQWLCPHLTNPKQTSSPEINIGDDGTEEIEWEEDWQDWDGTQTDTFASPGGSPISECWIAESKIAVGPTADTVAIGYRNRLLILASRWENKSKDGNGCMKLVQHWRGIVGQTDQDEISALLCLPLTSKKQSSTGAPDWTCIIVGFSSGHVSMYTENGMLLLTQMFDNSPVVNMKCRTFGPYNSPASHDLSEELVILYENSITTIDGFSLCQTLRGCRSQLAKAAASGGEAINLPPLGYKKWGLVDHQLVTDVAVVGIVYPSLYDYTSMITLERGLGQYPPTAAPAIFRYMTIGQVPYMGFLNAKESNTQLYMSDVAYHIASKLKNALVSAATGWLFGNKKTEEPEKRGPPKIEPATPLPFTCSLPDKRRTGFFLQLSPDRRLAAATDDFGRVVLVDVAKNLAVRMWKGYRDADCGWVEVEGEWHGAKRRTCFLLIYAPRRGLLEVWMPQQGPRVAAFNVPKQGRMLSTRHNLLGADLLNENVCQMYPVLFLTPEGNLLEVNVPFHLALGSKTSKKAKDMHLLKNLKRLRDKKFEDIMINVKEIKTTDARRQAVLSLLSSNHLTTDLLKSTINHLYPLYGGPSTDENPDAKPVSELNHDGLALGQQLKRLLQLYNFYQDIVSLHKSNTIFKESDKPTAINALSKHLHMTSSEIESILPNIIHNILEQSPNKEQVTFDNETLFTIGSFVRSWETYCPNINKDDTDVLPIKLVSNIFPEKIVRLCKFLFGWPWSSENVFSFKESLEKSGLDGQALMSLCLCYWNSIQDVELISILHMADVIHILTSFNKHLLINEDDNQISNWWKPIQDDISNWNKITHAYILSITCRGIHQTVTSSDQPETEEYSLMEWEGLSTDMVEWNVLIGKLERLLPLEKLLNYKVLSDQSQESVSKFEDVFCDVELIVSIKLLISKGKGYVSEVVSKWLLKLPLSIEKKIEVMHKLDEIFDKMEQSVENENENQEEIEGEKEKDMEVDQGDKEDKGTDSEDPIEVIKDLLIKTRKKFPESLKGDTIITNMTWETGANWQKDSEDVEKFAWTVQLLAGIQNCYVSHGLAIMMWDMWISKLVQRLTQMMDRMAKIPIDRYCYRELGFGLHSLQSFVHSVKLLIEHILEMNVVCEVGKPSHIKTDNFWRNIECSPPLIELTLTQQMSCYELVELHHELVTSIHIIVRHGLSDLKPLSFFNLKSRSMLFEPLHSNYPIQIVDYDPVKSSREKLFCSAICSIIDGLPDNLPPSQYARMPYKEIDLLCRKWRMSLDFLHRHHICYLYINGHDHLVDAILPMVNDTAALAAQFVYIAGKRLSYILATCPNRPDTIVLVRPTLFDWAQVQDYSKIRFDLTEEYLTSTSIMLDWCVRHAKGSEEKGLAVSLSESYKSIINKGITTR